LPCFSLSLRKHTLERHPAVARDSAKGRVTAGCRGFIGAVRGHAGTTTSGLQVDNLGEGVYWALGTYQGGGVLGNMGGAQKE